MSKPKRKLSNFLLTPKFQMKLTYYYISVGLSVIFATVSAVFFKMMQIDDVMNNSLPTDFTSQSQITEITFQIAQISMVGFVAFAIASFVFALMVSHRIAGPIVAISATIDELKKGNYDYGRNLRPNDELTLIMDGLHELRAVLKEKTEA
jgi:signal transduction histidine kinase